MGYHSFGEFYPFYLSEHSNRASRRLHFLGTSLSLALAVAAINQKSWILIVLALLQGYALA